ncbi:hypothetical protein PQO01_19550 [Lentisphaera marina]|uniref:hypothetical protein n=1 Tax=Lentisphaera marina TaxID=1111041 RepID=UPI0023673B23|nr:hypothetical protein [Lentisphaera marina]MDD7987152.1 hypothetical protein [Lentisphaera marina]
MKQKNLYIIIIISIFFSIITGYYIGKKHSTLELYNYKAAYMATVKKYTLIVSQLDPKAHSKLIHELIQKDIEFRNNFNYDTPSEKALDQIHKFNDVLYQIEEKIINGQTLTKKSN